MRIASLTLLVGSFLFLFSATVWSQDYTTKTIVSWTDPLTPPRNIKGECIKTGWTNGFKCRGLKCSHARWSYCTGWKMQMQWMHCSLYLHVPVIAKLPAALVDRAKQLAEVCAGVAIATSAGIGAATTPAAAVATLKPAFLACVSSRGGEALAALTVTVNQACGWQ